MSDVTPLHWDAARDRVRSELASYRTGIPQTIELDSALGRVLAADVVADRAYPPFPRSMRDGFAVRSADLPGRVRPIGEIRAGQPATQSIAPGECVEIMTGAPVPSSADAVVMVEHVTQDGDTVSIPKPIEPGANISPRGCEACPGTVVMTQGTRLDYSHISVLATVGATRVSVYPTPHVSIIATGDELVPVDKQPLDHQIRNSNAYSLAAQTRRAGALIRHTGLAIDTEAALAAVLEQAFHSDLILLSGGVSAGKYDLVEKVLADFGAEFFFDRVLIQPGQPLVFGKARDKYFFGLPGNPASTMVTFELFARLALQLMAGQRDPQLIMPFAVLTAPFRHKTGLTRFLPAVLEYDRLTPVAWRGSGDVFAMGRANAYLVADHNRESWPAGDYIRVLPR